MGASSARGGRNRPDRVSSACARSDFSGRRIGTLYPLAAGRRAGRRISYLAFGCGAAVGRAQVWGRVQREAVATALIGSLRRVLALIFPAGGLVLFIPWRLAAERGAEFSLALGGGAGAVGRAQVWGRAQ